MNPFRKALVKRAFDKLDDNKNGIIELDDIKRFYNAKLHPDVKAGKKTEDEVLGEFIDTFELHHSLKNPSEKDRKITPKEFMEYYNNVSASIDHDQYFELMMINAWKLHGEAPRKPGWTNVQKDADIYGKPLSVTKSAPFGVDSDPTDYQTSLRPKNQYQGSQNQPAAGSSSWGRKTDGSISG